MATPFVVPVADNTEISPLLLVNERVTGPAGAQLLTLAGDILAVESTDAVVVDSACGAGILTALIHSYARARGGKKGRRAPKVVAGDNDPKMVEAVRLRAAESGWKGVEALEYDHAACPLAEESAAFVLSNFGMLFVPDDGKVLSEARRVLREGGVAGYTSWKAIPWWQMAVEALRTHLSEAPALIEDPVAMFTPGWNDPAKTKEKLEKAGFKDVRAEVFKFKLDIGPEDFGLGTSALVMATTMRSWDAPDRAKFWPEIKSAIVKYLKETYQDGIWDGEMEAVITLGTK